MLSENWVRVSRNHPCPVCGKPDWCIISSDGAAVICPRIEEGSKRYIEGSGYLHLYKNNNRDAERERKKKRRRIMKQVIDAERLSRLYHRILKERDLLKPMADSLGVSIEAMIRLRAGWCPSKEALAFPMRTGGGEIIGIRLRNGGGRKWAVNGSRSGIFIPQGLKLDSTLYVCEGPTDTAAILDMGYDAIGRPDCTGGAGMVADFCRGKMLEVIIITDNDRKEVTKRQVRRGAEFLAKWLDILTRSVKIMRPSNGFKDVREMYHGTGSLLLEPVR